MVVYLNESVHPMAGVPNHLRQKKAGELVESWQDTWGIVCRGIEGSDILAVNIAGTTPHAVFAFLDSVAAVCVDLEPADIGCLAGRSVESFAAAKLLSTDPSVQQSCSRLEISEVMDTVGELLRLAMGVSERVEQVADELIASTPPGLRDIYAYDRAQDEEAMMQELRDAGIDVPSTKTLDAPPTPEPDGRFDDEYGIGPAQGKVDPWSFTYED